MRLVNSDLDKRISTKLDKSITLNGVNGIYNFGANNDYPQVIEKIVNGSVTAKNCVDIYSRFITGNGFEVEEINNVVVGTDSRGKKIKLKELLRQVSKSLAYFNGCYIHVNYKIDLTIKDAHLVPFKYIRFGKSDETGYTAKICLYENWEKDSDVKFDKSKIKDFNVFNSTNEVLEHEIKKAGGIEQYKGQIYFMFTDNMYTYPLSPFDPTYLDCDTEQQVGIFKNNTTRNGMLKKSIIRFATPDTEDDARELKKKFDNFVGMDGASIMGLYQDPNRETGILDQNKDFAIDNLESNINDKMFEGWQKELSNNIRKSLSIPPLFIDYDGSKLGGTSGESIIQDTNFFNQLTNDMRSSVSEMFSEIFSKWNDPILSSVTNWNIKKLSLYDNNMADSNSIKEVVRQ